MSDLTGNENAQYLEQEYQRFLRDPEDVEPSLRYFFQGMQFAEGMDAAMKPSPGDTRVMNLIRGYRKWGHLSAKIDPLGAPIPKHDQLDLAKYGFEPADLERHFATFGILDRPTAPLSDLIAALETTYCGPIGVEYIEGSSIEREQWFQERLESNFNQPQLSLEDKKRVLGYLNEAEIFERFLHTKYVGQKRFSLEGASGLIPCFSELIESLDQYGADEIILGMSHRGRLNVLANIMGKTYQEIFSEFEPNYLKDSVEGDGDVKYHKGFVADFETCQGGSVHITLMDNPSHLEAVNPLVLGLTRANQELRDDKRHEKIVPVLIHGDAAFPGQGIVAETLNMAKLRGYDTGGTIHIIINNQIGITTDPRDSRATRYCSDVARSILAPVLHVNGDDPESLVHAVRIISEFRQTFHQDIVLDLVCYRKHGHNEGDEPSFTQPRMYKKIRKLASTRKIYVDQMVQQGRLEAEAARALERDFRQRLEEALKLARSERNLFDVRPEGEHLHPYDKRTKPDPFTTVDTTVSLPVLEEIAVACTKIPDGFRAHPKAKRLMAQRRRAVLEEQQLDWGTAEILAYGSLLVQGIPVRLSGQDVERGTFSHRHSVLIDTETEQRFIPLEQVAKGGGHFSVYNSPLSENAVLGFEFGYSLARPKCLVIWEAQFGDFVNGAQIIIDQFIASSESKWNRVSDLVMFLPHGFEGQGPEHSSARLERFLQACAEDNIQVVNLTTPAQIFHGLRRQMLRSFRKPLVVMTPKSLLRHPMCQSPLSDLSHACFREIMVDQAESGPVKRVLFCSGKVYYDLMTKYQAEPTPGYAVIRVEQLYPFPKAAVEEALSGFPEAEAFCWVQEEPQNMGAWTFIRPHLEEVTGSTPAYIGREPSASPAVGSLRRHMLEQEKLVEYAFDALKMGVVTV